MTNRRRAKGRLTTVPFLALPMSMLKSDQFKNLSPAAAKLLLLVAASYRGRNNGDLACVWRQLRCRGLLSQQTFQAARTELVEKGWLEQTRKGGNRVASLYAITWRAMDESPKHEKQPTKKASNRWRKK